MIKIGIVIADRDEFLPLEKKMAELGGREIKVCSRKAYEFKIGNAEVTAVLCGIGKVNAAVAATALAEKGNDILLNCGLSGGISGVCRGQLTVPNRFLEHDFDLTGLGYKRCEKPQQEYIYEADKELLEQLRSVCPEAKVGTAVSGDCFVSNKELRDELKNEFSAMSCDMETAAIAYISDFSNTPFLSLRRISDDAGDDALDSYREMNTSGETVLSDLIIEFIKEIINRYEK